MIKSLIILAVFSSSLLAQTTIEPSQPTHYLYTPTAHVNPPYHLVLSFREISYALPGDIQVQASILDNIGRLSFGAKYGFSENLSLGVGIASTLIRVPNGVHGIPEGARPRFGMFLTYGFVQDYNFQMAVTPHTQIGDSRISMGADLGFIVTPVDVWSFMGETGLSLDFYDSNLYLYLAGGLRIHPPTIPFMNFDIGIDITEFPVNAGGGPEIAIFFDVIFSMITM
ncbi:hypothetical protein QA601_12150 [Chitinispirillales bacterium ANBcel5]|uniref:hypothetical protein n=1 Tax=Cellulosispirillum alkaliphilum TaxID=3039283 RepID=UPI002A550F4F|nr:hypothetical protein [Chitinispirillales bacterium ANBcel5]